MGQHSIYNMNFMYFQISPPNKPVEHISEELIAVFVGRSFPSTGWWLDTREYILERNLMSVIYVARDSTQVQEEELIRLGI